MKLLYGILAVAICAILVGCEDMQSREVVGKITDVRTTFENEFPASLSLESDKVQVKGNGKLIATRFIVTLPDEKTVAFSVVGSGESPRAQYMREASTLRVGDSVRLSYFPSSGKFTWKHTDSD